MGSLKPWQLVLVIVAVLVLGVSLWMTFSGPSVPNPGEITVVDVETGELYSIDTSGRKIALLPARHPETGEKRLFPVRRDDDGDGWIITPLGIAALERYEGDAAAITDRYSWTVNVADGKIRPLD